MFLAPIICNFVEIEGFAVFPQQVCLFIYTRTPLEGWGFTVMMTSR